MFFIGGFNTVLPYLLYISLIWAFMIIGLSGKLNIFKPGKAFQTETNASFAISVNSVHNPIQAFDYQDSENGIALVRTHYPDPVTSVFRIVPGVNPVICRYLHSMTFRGPPLSA